MICITCNVQSEKDAIASLTCIPLVFFCAKYQCCLHPCLLSRKTKRLHKTVFETTRYRNLRGFLPMAIPGWVWELLILGIDLKLTCWLRPTRSKCDSWFCFLRLAYIFQMVFILHKPLPSNSSAHFMEWSSKIKRWGDLVTTCQSLILTLNKIWFSVL